MRHSGTDAALARVRDGRPPLFVPGNDSRGRSGARQRTRATQLEELRAGVVPITRTGEHSDVTVINTDGRRVPWPEVSRFDDDDMRDLMGQVVDRLFTFGSLPRTLGCSG